MYFALFGRLKYAQFSLWYAKSLDKSTLDACEPGEVKVTKYHTDLEPEAWWINI